MPAKRNRRNITSNRSVNNSPGNTNTVDTPVSTNTAGKITGYSGPGKIASPIEYPYFGKDLKWTAVVALITIIVLIGAYYIFH
jgi:hypothetical protein